MRPAALPPARALVGAVVAVCGVLLGIGTLLWATDPPTVGPVQVPAASVGQDRGPQDDGAGGTDAGSDEVAVALPEDVAGPEDVAPPPGAAPPAAPAPQPPAPPAAPAPAAPAPAPAPVEQRSDRSPVLVLNNSRIDGLAARAAAVFESGGWPVRDTGSLRGRIRATTVYYPPGQQDQARAFAERFGGIERVLPRLAELPGSGLTVVVTRDFRP